MMMIKKQSKKKKTKQNQMAKIILSLRKENDFSFLFIWIS